MEEKEKEEKVAGIVEKKRSWRDSLGRGIKPYVEKLISESSKYSDQYREAPDKGKAQLWIALSFLARQTYDLELKFKYLERALRDIARGKQEAQIKPKAKRKKRREK